MTRWFYLRWGGILLLGAGVAALGLQRYEREVTTVTPEEVVRKQPADSVRVIGRVEAGSLERQGEGRAAFRLAGRSETLTVRYAGAEPENLRELKTLVLIGRWDPGARELRASEITLIPNYGYVAAAYLVAMIPVGLFLFRMERRVGLMYTEIKTAKAYEPEVEPKASNTIAPKASSMVEPKASTPDGDGS